MAVFAFAFFVLLFVRIPEPNAAATTEPISTLMKGALKFRHFVLGAIAIFVYVGIEVGVPGTLNLFLTDPVEKGGAGIVVWPVLHSVQKFPVKRCLYLHPLWD